MYTTFVNKKTNIRMVKIMVEIKIEPGKCENSSIWAMFLWTQCDGSFTY